MNVSERTEAVHFEWDQVQIHFLFIGFESTTEIKIPFCSLIASALNEHIILSRQLAWLSHFNYNQIVPDSISITSNASNSSAPVRLISLRIFFFFFLGLLFTYLLTYLPTYHN